MLIITFHNLVAEIPKSTTETRRPEDAKVSAIKSPLGIPRIKTISWCIFFAYIWLLWESLGSFGQLL
jgi:hypothetical protein